MDFLSNLRLRSLFGGNQPPTTPYQNVSFTSPTPSPEEEEMDVPTMMNNIYQPEHEASDRYNELIGNMPTRQGPSFLRTLAAGLTAFGPGGMSAANEVIDQPNINAMADWKNQIAPAQHAADLERQNNVNERTLAYQTVSQQLRAKSDQMKNLNNKANIDIKAHRAAVYEFKVMHPNAKIVMPKGGNIIAIDPNTKETTTLTDENGQPIPSGSMTENDKLHLQHDNAMEEIDTKIQGQKDVEGVRQTGRENIAETRGWQIASIPNPDDPTKQMAVKINQITGEVVPVTMNGKPTGPVTKMGGPSTTPGANDPAKLQKIQESARGVISAIDSMFDTKTGHLTSDVNAAVGANRLLPMYKLPGSRARIGEKTINNLKANLVLQTIAEMKAQSKTGATGFGALNLKELGVLEDAASKLDPGLPVDAFEAELKRIREKFNKILQPTDGMTNTVTSTPPKKLSVDELMKKYGGK
jgi:hypothetical protein